MSSSQESRAVVEKFLAAFSSGDVAATLAMMSESGTWWVAGTLPISGTYDKAAFSQMLGGIAEACEGPITLTPKAWTCDGERVAVETESLAHLKNGRVYNNHYHFLFVVRDGKIAEVKEYLDTMHTQAIFFAP